MSYFSKNTEKSQKNRFLKRLKCHSAKLTIFLRIWYHIVSPHVIGIVPVNFYCFLANTFHPLGPPEFSGNSSYWSQIL